MGEDGKAAGWAIGKWRGVWYGRREVEGWGGWRGWRGGWWQVVTAFFLDFNGG